ncbi:MAG: bifunctional folylpolyglutamate synthase/dihydrofolate synthase [Candidatus Cryptobacteroides sp.]
MFSEEDYSRVIEEIFRRHPSVQVSGFNGRTYKAGIESMSAFDHILGQPWKAYPCIHIAGTNGKGSVSSLLACNLALPRAQAIGLYTSPHLLDFRERIKIITESGYEMISKEEVLQFLNRYENDLAQLSFFEITTGMAFWWFKHRGVDAAVIETGLGGRLDSTNIILPQLSIVTSIGLDHCAMLGSTRAEIASEKAGIFKKDVPALVWGHDAECDPVFASIAAQVGAPLHFATEQKLPEQFLSPDFLAGMDLKGEYQANNLRTALAALDILGEEASERALKHCAGISGLRGRWEVLENEPLTICDIGHNPAALEYNFRQLKALGRPMRIVYGIMKDKALEDIAPLLPAQAEYYLCAPRGSRSLGVPELFSRLKACRPELKLHCFEAPEGMSGVKLALEEARRNAGPEDVIYIGGSNFVVAEALE